MLVGEVGPVTVSGINVTTRWATVRNLTVDDIHTYSVHNGHDEHGKCAEISCMSEALDSGADVTGGTISAINVRGGQTR